MRHECAAQYFGLVLKRPPPLTFLRSRLYCVGLATCAMYASNWMSAVNGSLSSLIFTSLSAGNGGVSLRVRRTRSARSARPALVFWSWAKTAPPRVPEKTQLVVDVGDPEVGGICD